jgi:hypothetical protein
LWLLNKKQDVEVDTPNSSGVLGNYLKYVSFPWPPPEAALLVFNVSFLIKKTVFEKEVIKTKEIAINADS